jgi:hypothetical protein
MRLMSTPFLVLTLAVPATDVSAQSLPSVAPVVAPTPQSAPPVAEPALLTLPMGARVRLRTDAAPGGWMKGILASADSASVAIVPENAPPLGGSQLRVPSASIARFEMATGTKRQWLPGLIAGAAFGLLIGVTADVDPVACQYDIDYECSRGEALALYGGTMAAVGAGVGALVKRDVWTPVALDALAPPPARVSGVAAQLRLLPRGGVALGLAVGF